MQEAEAIARQCVDSCRGGGTVMPRILPLDEDGLVIETLYEAEERFEHIVANMVESDETINRRKSKDTA